LEDGCDIDPDRLKKALASRPIATIIPYNFSQDFSNAFGPGENGRAGSNA
jgi:hypothetical protein